MSVVVVSMCFQKIVALGVDKEWVSILSLLSNKISVKAGSKINSSDVVNLLLRKIRLNESYQILGHEFGIGKQHVVTIFRNYLGFVAEHFKELVVWPSQEII